MARPVNCIPVLVAGARSEVRRLIVALAAAASLLLALPVVLVGSATPVAGHSQLLISVPAAGQVVPVGPTQISLVFGEPIEAHYTSLDLLDGVGRTLLAKVEAPDPIVVIAVLLLLGSLLGLGFTMAGGTLPRPLRETSRPAVLGGSLVGGVLGIVRLIGGSPR